MAKIERKRGALLGTLLVLGMLVTVYATYQTLFNEAENRRISRELAARGYTIGVELPRWYYPYAGFMSIAAFCCYFAIWDFLKPGPIGLALVSVAAVVINRQIGVHGTWWLHVSSLTYTGVIVMLAVRHWPQMRWLPTWSDDEVERG